ncbi:lysostaphin resistance A-like protein [Candidatus Marsarchaeota archaeon]|nr:lysostaphin resistance A-like protein [Candidatus Marsarchaeota archaeon]MCL5100154.1 lysostaphin resistance A-like protein [Candidatus Marsarchaeota archaeon]
MAYGRRKRNIGAHAHSSRAGYSFEASHPNIRYIFYLSLAVCILLGFIVFGALYAAGLVNLATAEAGSSMALSLFFLLVVFSYLLWRGRTLRQIISSLGLSRSALTARNIGIGVALFAAILVVELAIGAFSVVTGISLPTNTAQIFSGLPAYFLAFALIVAPLDEEILFRGFMVPRIGIVLSALLFGLLHLLSYLSISEFIAALAFGLLAGYVFRRTGSLYPSIAAHMLVNALGILALIASMAL